MFCNCRGSGQQLQENLISALPLCRSISLTASILSGFALQAAPERRSLYCKGVDRCLVKPWTDTVGPGGDDWNFRKVNVAVREPRVHDVGSCASGLHPHGCCTVSKGEDATLATAVAVCHHPAHHDARVLGVTACLWPRRAHGVGGGVEDDALHRRVLAKSRGCTNTKQREVVLTAGLEASQVAGRVPPDLRVLVHVACEDLLVSVLQGEVEGLRGEVANVVGQATPPEGQHALLLGDAHGAVHDAFIRLVGGDLLTEALHLQQQLDPLRPGHRGLQCGSGEASGHEVLAKEVISSIVVVGQGVDLGAKQKLKPELEPELESGTQK
ncbi:hypothetical protein TREES_T100019293 [Tupaia chinensis]|uniref:Uncharacterized protein n=1 Tax=Tupaia chinensis TaxID=246437 RepID=L9L8J3_TUPCH|nr:hypothetical protein TREES_T100019293 [Tupaia chinensis]